MTSYRLSATGTATWGHGGAPAPAIPADAFPPLNSVGLPVLPPRYESGPYLCQLAQEENRDAWPEWGAIVDEKIDGIRAIWLGVGAPFTRENTPIECIEWMVPALDVLAGRLGPGRWVIDCELTVGPDIDSTIAAVRRKRHQAGDAVLHVFDALPFDQWKGGLPTEPLHERKRRLREAFALGPIPGLLLVNSWECADPRYLDQLVGRVWDAGGEGVVVKDRRSHYACSRTRAWWKVKRSATYSVEINGWVPMRFKPGNEPPDGEPRLGALIGTFQGRPVRISAGFSDADRLKWARLGPSIPGRIAEVEAMERTKTGSLRHARFVRWRHEGEG